MTLWWWPGWTMYRWWSRCRLMMPLWHCDGGRVERGRSRCLLMMLLWHCDGGRAVRRIVGDLGVGWWCCCDSVMAAGLNDAGRGLNVVVVNPRTKEVIRVGHFDTFGSGFCLLHQLSILTDCLLAIVCLIFHVIFRQMLLCYVCLMAWAVCLSVCLSVCCTCSEGWTFH